MATKIWLSTALDKDPENRMRGLMLRRSGKEEERTALAEEAPSAEDRWWC